MAYRQYDGDYPTAPSTNQSKDINYAEPARVFAKDIMSTKLITVLPDDPIMKVVDLLSKHRISGMPVIDQEGHLAGVISEKDTFKLILQGKFTQALAGKVSDYMSTEVETVSPEDDVFKIANLFYSHSYRRLPVIKDGKVAGLISRRDILKTIQDMGH